MPKPSANSIVTACAMLWLVAIGFGLWMLWTYQNSPGVAGIPPSHWPANSQIQPEPGRATLVMVAHPRCPCTRASIGELALLMARCQGQVSAHVLFFKPVALLEGWEKTDLWDSAANIPGVEVFSDEGGVEAVRFNAITSGATMLYDADGRLLFSGGITGSRGHSGDNEGRSTIVALVTGEAVARAETRVFGCSLVNEDQPCSERGRICSK